MNVSVATLVLFVSEIAEFVCLVALSRIGQLNLCVSSTSPMLGRLAAATIGFYELLCIVLMSPIAYHRNRIKITTLRATRKGFSMHAKILLHSTYLPIYLFCFSNSCGTASDTRHQCAQNCLKFCKRTFSKFEMFNAMKIFCRNRQLVIS